MNPFSLSGTLALATGATRGIGFGIAQALAETGAGLVLVARDQVLLGRVGEELGRKTSPVYVSPCDLLKTSEIADWYDEHCVRTGAPEILVNAAVITRRGKAIDFSLESWSEVLTVIATAFFELSRNFARKRIKCGVGGKIINVASLMTFAARAGTSAYTASKGTVGQLTKALAVEWAKHGIGVNAIAPGYIDTDLNKLLRSDPKLNAWALKRCPVGRWGTPEDIAWPAVFLASPTSDFIIGQVICVDGAWQATF
jgi:NAD(P)-dependent dehydrogenase (short-subunit alcohol dehydrogenase family)